MSRIKWGEPGERTYEVGVDRGVFYPEVGPAVPWNGLVSITETSDGGDYEPIYFEGVKVGQVVLSEDFEATIEAISSPMEFARCEGSAELVPGLFVTQQPRETFSLSYRTLIGNDTEGTDFAYKLHLVYNILVEPSDRQIQTISDQVDISARSWTARCVPPPATTYRPTAHLVFDSRRLDILQLQDIESFLYGRDDLEPSLLMPADILEILANVIEEPLGPTI